MADTAPENLTEPTDTDAAAIEDALDSAQQAVSELATDATDAPPDDAAPQTPDTQTPDTEPRNIDLPNFQEVLQSVEANGIKLLHDVDLNVKIELGRTHLLVEDVLKLTEGSVVELDKLAGDPVDVLVNDQLVARGEVLVLNDTFCVRVSEIVALTIEPNNDPTEQQSEPDEVGGTTNE